MHFHRDAELRHTHVMDMWKPPRSSSPVFLSQALLANSPEPPYSHACMDNSGGTSARTGLSRGQMPTGRPSDPRLSLEHAARELSTAQPSIDQVFLAETSERVPHELAGSSTAAAAARLPPLPPGAADAQRGDASWARPLAAEAIGTGFYMLLGLGACSAQLSIGAFEGTLQLAAIWGTSVSLAVYATSAVSGAHLNTAVTAAHCFFNGFSPIRGLAYAAAQLAGATAAVALNLILYQHTIRDYEDRSGLERGSVEGLGSAPGLIIYSHLPAGVDNPCAALAVEALCTAVLVFTFFTFVHPLNGAVPDTLVPALVGGVVAVLTAIYCPLTGAGFNPARDLAPRIVYALGGWGAGTFTDWWVYTVGPLLGLLLGGGLSAVLYERPRPCAFTRSRQAGRISLCKRARYY